MGKIVIGYNDYVKDAVAITSDSALATLPAANVAAVQVSQRWQTVPATTTAYLLIDLGTASSIEMVALINTNLSAAATWRIRISTADATGDTGDALDTTAINAGVDTRYKKAIYVLSSAVTGRYVKINLIDASLPYLAVGRAVVCKAFKPTYNFSPNAQVFYRDWSNRYSAYDGQTWVLRGSMQRGFAFVLPAVTDTERNSIGEELLQDHGIHQDVLVCLDQASTNLGRDSVWGLLEEMPAWTRHANGYANIACKIVDRL